jgi:archaellum component FlaC
MASRSQRNPRPTSVSGSDLNDTRSTSLSGPDPNDSTALKSDDIVNDRMEAMFMRITKSITESFTLCITKLVTAIEEKINTKIDAQSSEVFNLANKIDQLEKRVDDLMNNNNNLSAQLHSLIRDKQQLQQTVDNLEQYTRADSILIHGMPLPQTGTVEDLYTEIPHVLNNLIPNMHLTPDMISVTHRLPSQTQPNISSGSSTSTNRTPPVVVRFTRRFVRSQLMANRKHLKGKHIVLTDHLTPARSALLRKATTMVNAHKIAAAWTQDGKLLLKTLQNRTVTVVSEDDLSPYN